MTLQFECTKTGELFGPSAVDAVQNAMKTPPGPYRIDSATMRCPNCGSALKLHAVGRGSVVYHDTDEFDEIKSELVEGYENR